MFHSAIIYTLTMVLMFLYGIILTQKIYLCKDRELSFYNIEIIPLCMLFAFVFGVRYNVGVDYLEYLYIYQTGDGVERFEPIFQYVTKLFSQNGVHYSFYFALWAFLQSFFIFYTFKDDRNLFPFLILTLFMGSYFIHWMNGIRQTLAGCIFIYSLKYIDTRNFFKYLLCCLLAFSFHKSAIALLIFYPLLKSGKDFTFNRIIQLLILLFVSLLSISHIDLIQRFFPMISAYIELFGYSAYSEDKLNMYSDVTSDQVGASLYIDIVLNFLIIFKSKSMKEYFASRKFDIFYNLYYWGNMLLLLSINNLVLNRPFRYFRDLQMIMIALLLYYLYKNGSIFNQLIFLFLLGILGILFIAIIKNHPYTFFWDA